MTRNHIRADILQEEYGGFRALIPGDQQLPRSYGEWMKRCEKEDAATEVLGETVQKVIVYLTDFTEYCQTTGQPVSYRGIEVTAEAKRWGWKQKV